MMSAQEHNMANAFLRLGQDSLTTILTNDDDCEYWYLCCAATCRTLRATVRVIVDDADRLLLKK